MEFPTEVSYFGLKTPVFLPTLILLELGDADYKGHPIKGEDWPELKKKTPGAKLPFVKFQDGELLTESGAIGRTVAGAAGLLYSGRDYAKSERLVGMSADMHKTVILACYSLSFCHSISASASLHMMTSI